MSTLCAAQEARESYPEIIEGDLPAPAKSPQRPKTGMTVSSHARSAPSLFRFVFASSLRTDDDFSRVFRIVRIRAGNLNWAANKRFEISKFKFPRARTYELIRSRSGCIEAKFCKLILVGIRIYLKRRLRKNGRIGKLSPRSTQCTPLHRSQISEFSLKIAEFFAVFFQNFAKFAKYG